MSARPKAPGPNPPQARASFVVRAGPPNRRRWAEVGSGVLGAFLLLLSSVFAFTLPKEDVLLPQFQVTFKENQVDLLSQERFFDLTDGGRQQEFVFNITHNDVTTIVVNVHFMDDLAASDPDRFQVELLDPDGDRQGAPAILANPVPKQNAGNPSEYTPLQATATYSFSLRPHPEDVIVEGALNSTEESIALEQADLQRFNTQGGWRVRVFLIQAGDCPSPSASQPAEAIRGAACVQENSGQGAGARVDRGNPFTVGSFSYRHFTVSADRLE